LQVTNRYPLTLIKGKGAHVWDNKGNRYIDSLAGIAVNSVGHCHPKVVKAIKRQSDELMHISALYTSKPQSELAERLCKSSGLGRIFFTNSGAEANETAIKVARKHAHSKNRGGTIISFENCFHGRTLATVATGQKKYQEGFEPIPAGFIQLPFNDLKILKKHITEDVAAIMLEIVQGEGGIRLIEQKFIAEIRSICDEEDIVLIIDEIQTGMGRTGKMYAHEHFDVKPDIMTIAKSLGGGFPIGAALFREKIASAVKYGDHGTTFGGNPLACSAALAVLEVLEEECLIEHSSELGTHAMKKIQDLAVDEEAVLEVRGLGLMIGIELSFPARPVVLKLLEKGIIGNVVTDKVLRLVPPLVIKEEDIDVVIEEIFKSIKEIKSDVKD
ncbi:aspartate aminotransferase family protein, partial [Bacteroidota bacterium]